MLDRDEGMRAGGEMRRPTRLASEFDNRLAEVWLSVFECEAPVEELGESFAWFLRMAYLKGYEDALCEPERGSLYANLGLPVPTRSTGRRRR